MKNVFSFFFFLLLSNAVFGQIEWVGNHQFSESASDLVRTSQGHCVMLHGNGSGITVFDDNGNILLNDTVFVFTEYGQSDIIEFPDSSFMYITGGLACDVFFSYFVKYDKNWNQTSADYCLGNSNIARFSDNSFAALNSMDDLVERLGPDGNQVWYKDFYDFEIFDLAVTPGDTLLIASEDGLLRLTKDGTIVDTFPNLVFERLEILPNGNLLALTNDVLFLLNPDFDISAAFQQTGDSIEDIVFDQNEIAVLTSAPAVARLGFGLNQIGLTPLSGHHQTFAAVAFSDDGYWLAGGEQYGNASHQNHGAFVKSFSLDGTTGSTLKDVELTSVSANDELAFQNFGWVNLATIQDISFTIKNNGPTPIQRIEANMVFPIVLGLGECYVEQTFSKPFENLDLQPGASKVLDWGNQELYLNNLQPGQVLEFCMWTSLPDHHLETNNDNDVSCTEVLVAAHEPFPIAFYHAFNPVADMLYLEMKSQVDAANANIFNAAGQLVYTAPIDGQSQNLDLSGLPDGAYFLQIVSGERVGWGKFAKY